MTFTVISDHGMTPVHSQYDLVGKIEALGFSMPKDYLSVYDSTMARYWFFNDAARNAILGELSRTSCGRIVDDPELERLGILFPDRRYGEVCCYSIPLPARDQRLQRRRMAPSGNAWLSSVGFSL